MHLCLVLVQRCAGHISLEGEISHRIRAHVVDMTSLTQFTLPFRVGLFFPLIPTPPFLSLMVN
jgi:hypothetical protein